MMNTLIAVFAFLLLLGFGNVWLLWRRETGKSADLLLWLGAVLIIFGLIITAFFALRARQNAQTLLSAPLIQGSYDLSSELEGQKLFVEGSIAPHVERHNDQYAAYFRPNPETYHFPTIPIVLTDQTLITVDSDTYSDWLWRENGEERFLFPQDEALAYGQLYAGGSADEPTWHLTAEFVAWDRYDTFAQQWNSGFEQNVRTGYWLSIASIVTAVALALLLLLFGRKRA